MEQIPLTVTDIKKFTYCPRTVYYKYCQPVHCKTTYKMRIGEEEHRTIETRERKRTLQRYDLHKGERSFKVKLLSDRLGLTGILDMMIRTSSEIIPVEFKNSINLCGLSHKYQLTAYTLLLEDCYDQPVKRGFVYQIPTNEIQQFIITRPMRDYVIKTISQIRNLIRAERFPDTKFADKRCRDCEYQNYCGDV